MAARLFLALCLLLVSTPSWAAIAFVQTRSAEAGNFDSTTLAYNSGVVAGNLLVNCGANWDGASTTAIVITDSVGTSYTTVLGSSSGSTPNKVWIAYGIAAGSGANTVTINPDVSGAFASYTIAEFSGIDTTPLDASGTPATGSSTSAASSVTAVATSNLVLACMSQGSGGNWGLTSDTGGGWTTLGEIESASNAPHHAQYQVFSSAGSKTATATIAASVPWSSLSLSFEAAASGANVSHFYRRRAK